MNTSLDVPLKSGVYARLVKIALSIRKNLGFDLEESRVLCSQLNQYKKKEFSFDLEFEYGFKAPINWWSVIETKPQPNSLPLIALHLFSICPNSASCERGFSTLGWLTNKHRLQLGAETLETRCKMITYWKSNPRKELGFFGQDIKSNSRLSDIELNHRITEALAEPDDADEGDIEFEDTFQLHVENSLRQTINGEIILDIVLIEYTWIENDIDLSDKLILQDIGKIPEDLEDDLFNNTKGKDKDESMIIMIQLEKVF